MITKLDYLNFIDSLLRRMRRVDSVIDLAYIEDIPQEQFTPTPIGRRRRLTIHWVEGNLEDRSVVQFENMETLMDICIDKYGLMVEWPDSLLDKLKAILAYIEILEDPHA